MIDWILDPYINLTPTLNKLQAHISLFIHEIHYAAVEALGRHGQEIQKSPIPEINKLFFSYMLVI